MNTYEFTAVLVVAAVTILTRFMPFLILGKRTETPVFVSYLGDLLPGSIMILLVLYCLRNDFSAFPRAMGVYCALFIFFLQYLKKNTFLSMFLGTALYMILVNVF